MFLISIIAALRNASSESVELYMQKRSENGPLNGLWEFPGGKIEKDELPYNAALREFSEETGLILDKSNYQCHLFNLYKYDYPDRSVCLYVHIMRGDSLAVEGGEWIEIPFDSDLDDIKTLENNVVDANKLIIRDLMDYLGRQFREGDIETLWMRQ